MTRDWAPGPGDEDDEITPDNPDWDLSEEHGYTWEPKRTSPLPVWLMVVVSLLLIIGLVLPALVIILGD